MNILTADSIVPLSKLIATVICLLYVAFKYNKGVISNGVSLCMLLLATATFSSISVPTGVSSDSINNYLDNIPFVNELRSKYNSVMGSFDETLYNMPEGSGVEGIFKVD